VSNYNVDSSCFEVRSFTKNKKIDFDSKPMSIPVGRKGENFFLMKENNYWKVTNWTNDLIFSPIYDTSVYLNIQLSGNGRYAIAKGINSKTGWYEYTILDFIKGDKAILFSKFDVDEDRVLRGTKSSVLSSSAKNFYLQTIDVTTSEAESRKLSHEIFEDFLYCSGSEKILFYVNNK
jgi:outer membrane receptor for monomeric catechols